MSKLPTLQFLNSNAREGLSTPVVAVDTSYVRLSSSGAKQLKERMSAMFEDPSKKLYARHRIPTCIFPNGDVERTAVDHLRRVCIVLRVRIVIYSGQLEDK